MDTTFYIYGVQYLRWENNGKFYEAVKEQVDFLGKEVFEQELKDEEDELEMSCDGVTFHPLWFPTKDELYQSIKDRFNYLRAMEVM